MAGRKLSKVSKIEEETRREQLQRGVKQGTVKNSIDKAVDKFGDPVSERMKEVLKKIHPNAAVTDGAVDSFVKSSFILGFAEVLGASKILGGKIPLMKGVDAEKFEELASYMRGYAGERNGTAAADGVFELAPMVAEALANPDLKTILSAVSDDRPPALPEAKKDFVDLDSELKKLEEEDDDG